MSKELCDETCTCGCQEGKQCTCEHETTCECGCGCAEGKECTCGCEEGQCECDETCTCGCQDKK